MRLRGQLAAIVVVSLLAILTVFYTDRWSSRRVSEFQAAQNDGVEILIQMKRIHAELQLLMLELFSPEGYSPIVDILQQPVVTVGQFASAIASISSAYEAFFENDKIRSLLQDRMLERKYAVIQIVGKNALRDLERIRSHLDRMEGQQELPPEILFREFLVIDDENTTSLLADVRYVSHFFSVTFERFLESFVGRLQKNAQRLQQQTLWVARTTAITAMMLGIGLSIAFAGRLTKRLRYFLDGVEELSTGDFSLNLPEGREDEIGVLIRRFNRVSRELARNVDSITGLMTTVADRITERPEFPPVLEIICDETLQYTNADTVLISSADGNGNVVQLCNKSRLDQTKTGQIRSWAEFALPTRVDPNLRMSVGTLRDHLSDLDVTNIRTLTKYVVLLINHNDVYRELAERRQVAFEALQAQIQPHFLFNVLSALFGLNRKGDRNGVERSVICLRDMMKYIVELSDTAHLCDEMDFVEKYLELQQIRFSEQMTTHVSCHPDVARAIVPRLVLQPLVENAVVHGVGDRRSNASVTVSAVPLARDRCRISISDNGRGFDVSSYLANSHCESPYTHIGLANVQRRLAIRFPSSAFRIESGVDLGTTVIIELPVSHAGDDAALIKETDATADSRR